MEDFKPGGRDVVFVPVALNYDRVLEDRFLIAADQSGVRRFRPPLGSVLRGLGSHLWKRITWRFREFGTATVSFGDPLSLGAFIATATNAPVEAVAAELMRRVSAVVPVLPVPLVARCLRSGLQLTKLGLCAAVQVMLDQLHGQGIPLPRRDAEQIVADALTLLRERQVIVDGPDGIRIVAGEEPLIAYYANSVAHHFERMEVSSER